MAEEVSADQQALEASLRYAGFSGAHLNTESFDLRHGVILRRTYAHLMMPQLMAFREAEPGKPHPAPWIAASGSRGIDITIELELPDNSPLGGEYNSEETAWWIGSLIRISQAPYLSMPVLADQRFAEVPDRAEPPILKPLETEPAIFGSGEEKPVLDDQLLGWLAANWRSAGVKLLANDRFITAFRAFDQCRFVDHNSSAMLMVWGAIEQLFAPAKGELRFRVSALLASYLEEAGTERHELYRRIKKLYDSRSMAAHSAHAVDKAALFESWVLLRNSLMKMVLAQSVPTPEQLEQALFGSRLPTEENPRPFPTGGSSE